MHLLDTSLALEAEGSGLWRATADPRFEAANGMFGGWTVALLLKAAIEHPDAAGTPVAITVNFVATVPPGGILRVRVNCLGAGRSVSQWRCDLTGDGSDSVLASALVILAIRRDSDGYHEGEMPRIPEPETLAPFFPPFPGKPPLEIRLAGASPPFNQGHTRTVGWERETTDRPLDVLTLAVLSDLGLPRILTVSPPPRLSATLTLSVTFLAGDAELAACGAGYILSEMTATRIEQSLVGTRKIMWSRTGAVLATAEQVCWYR